MGWTRWEECVAVGHDQRRVRQRDGSRDIGEEIRKGGDRETEDGGGADSGRQRNRVREIKKTDWAWGLKVSEAEGLASPLRRLGSPLGAR